jgi:hypothetical protein
MMLNVFCATYMATSKAKHWTAFCGLCSVLLNGLQNLCVRILSKEHTDAENLDYMLGIGVPDGYGIGGSDWRRGMAAKFDLIHRVREVNAKLSTFSEYTIEFANLFAQRWDCSTEPAR